MLLCQIDLDIVAAQIVTPVALVAADCVDRLTLYCRIALNIGQQLRRLTVLVDLITIIAALEGNCITGSRRKLTLIV